MRKYLLAAAGLFVLVVLQQAGVFWTPPPSAAALEGVVEAQDADTLPANIYVIASWRAQTGMSSTRCMHMEVTTTNSDGTWSFPMWQDWRHNRRAVLFIEVYSPGQLVVAESVAQDRWKITPHQGSLLEYLTGLRRLRVDCGMSDRSIVNGIVVWREVLRDILTLKTQAIAPSDTESGWIDSLSWEYSKRVVDPTFELPRKTRHERMKALIHDISKPKR